MVKTKTKKVSKPKKSQDVITVRTLLKKVWQMIHQNWKMFAIFTIIYGLFLVILVQGPTKINIGDVQTKVTNYLPEESQNSTLVAGVLVGESADIGQVGATYGMFLFIIFSLAMIWLLRAMYEGKQVRVRDGFYRGMVGLVPVIIIYGIMVLQLLPMTLGGIVFSIVSLNGIAVNVVESAIVWMFALGLMLLSAYFLASSIMAIYVVTLPDVSPMEALGQSKKIVKGRRAKIMVRMICGVIIYGLIAGLGLLVLISIIPSVAVYWWWLVGAY